MNARTPSPGEKTEAVKPVEAKQGTDAPKGMPVVLIVSLVGAAVAMWAIWSIFFAQG
ncbi:hypothetical protein [Hansschlegelia sp. KR7-227]|uniref:hypothetical protein n=1 Tax=Hansschlegelia sp. KR7-227 TaxID=3400914 RepID=UPI003C00B0BC